MALRDFFRDGTLLGQYSSSDNSDTDEICLSPTVRRRVELFWSSPNPNKDLRGRVNGVEFLLIRASLDTRGCSDVGLFVDLEPIMN